MNPNKPIFYLAAPYTHPDPSVREWRLRAVLRQAYDCFKKGRLVYSPLTHNIPIDNLGFHGDFQTWLEFDHGMLSRCDGLLLLKLPGWENSKGMKAEIECAKRLDLPIEEINPTLEFLNSIS